MLEEVEKLESLIRQRDAELERVRKMLVSEHLKQTRVTRELEAFTEKIRYIVDENNRLCEENENLRAELTNSKKMRGDSDNEEKITAGSADIFKAHRRPSLEFLLDCDKELTAEFDQFFAKAKRNYQRVEAEKKKSDLRR